jgi:hypothetical protein
MSRFRGFGTALFAAASSLIAIGAGVYLLLSQTADEGSFLEVIAHGMGAYFIAKGLYLYPSLMAQARSAHNLAYLADQEEARAVARQGG